MKKIFCMVVAIVMSFSVFFCFAGCHGENNNVSAEESAEVPALILRNDTYTTYVGNGINLGYFVDLKAEGIGNENEATGYGITVVSDDLSVAKMDGRWLKGLKIGSTKIKLIYNEKEATITFNVIPMMEYLKKESEANGNKGMYYHKYWACRYFVNAIEQFKNPSSVEVMKVLKHTTEDGIVDYYMMQCRAQNSYGGNTIDWFIVDSDGISEGFSPYLTSFIMLDGFSPIMSTDGDAKDITLAVKEYLAGECI